MIDRLKLFLVLNLVTVAVFGTPSEQFDEELSIVTLGDGKVASHFSFKTLLRGAAPRDPKTLSANDRSQHYSVFPLALGQILREYAVTELHLTLNAGNWNYEQWGPAYDSGSATGAELWAWMGMNEEQTSIDDRWRGLRNSLSGLFCASLATSDDQRINSPSSFPPEGFLPKWPLQHQLRHMMLPSEHVCTENLTPFLKLLPCKSLAGIASLLNPHKIFDADWHGLGLHVTWHPEKGVEARFSFLVVSDPVRVSDSHRQEWSLFSTFNRNVQNVCPMASSSRILVALPTENEFTLIPEPSTRTTDSAVFELSPDVLPLNIVLRSANFDPLRRNLTSGNGHLAPLSIQRTLRGSSQAYGQLRTTIRNTNQAEIRAIYLENMPWFIQFYLHTLRTSCDNVVRDDIINDIVYIPPISHTRPSKLKLSLRVPPSSTVQITMEVAKGFLRYTEHPPDAQRGWDLPPAVLTPVFGSGEADVDATNSSREFISTGHSLRMYTSTLLVDLATPDFSMPYNVIIFSCSLIAFIFGSIFNLLTRKFVVVVNENQSDNGS